MQVGHPKRPAARKEKTREETKEVDDEEVEGIDRTQRLVGRLS